MFANFFSLNNGDSPIFSPTTTSEQYPVRLPTLVIPALTYGWCRKQKKGKRIHFHVKPGTTLRNLLSGNKPRTSTSNSKTHWTYITLSPPLRHSFERFHAKLMTIGNILLSSLKNATPFSFLPRLRFINKSENKSENALADQVMSHAVTFRVAL